MWVAEPTLLDVSFVARNMREVDRQEFWAVRSPERRNPDSLTLEIMNKPGRKFTVGLDRPIAVFGAQELWPGSWNGWFFATDESPKIIHPLTQFLRRKIKAKLIELGAHRCDVRSIEGHTEAHRWLGLLGAIPEARLKRYGAGGQDFIVFRWDFGSEDSDAGHVRRPLRS